MGLEGILKGLDAPVAALEAERLRMSVIAQNIANAQVTRTAEGGPYVRRTVRFETVRFESVLREAGTRSAERDGRPAGGVRVAAVERDTRTPFTVVHQPGHEDADAEGNVRYPNVDLVQEMVDFNVAKRSYEANLAVFRAWRGMMRSAISNMAT